MWLGKIRQFKFFCTVAGKINHASKTLFSNGLSLYCSHHVDEFFFFKEMRHCIARHNIGSCQQFIFVAVWGWKASYLHGAGLMSSRDSYGSSQMLRWDLEYVNFSSGNIPRRSHAVLRIPKQPSISSFCCQWNLLKVRQIQVKEVLKLDLHLHLERSAVPDKICANSSRVSRFSYVLPFLLLPS